MVGVDDSTVAMPRDFFYYYGDLVHPLAEDESPDRIYEDVTAMVATARYWIMCQIVNIQGAFYAEPGTWMSARYSQLIDVWGDAMRLDWPLRYNGRRLAMVIRQWVEEETQSKYFAIELSASDQWNSLVQYARERGQFQMPSDQKTLPALLRSVAIRLERAGLPSNPSTARYFLAVVNEQSEPLPVRGILVTTLCYMTPPYHDVLPQPGRIRFEHPSETIITGVTQWTPGTLLARVNNVTRSHQRFMEANEAAPYIPTYSDTSYKARQRSQNSIRSESSLDYVESAVRDIRSQGLRPIDERDTRFVTACGTSYRATKGRIDRYNMKHPDEPPIPSTPPGGWRGDVLKQLR